MAAISKICFLVIGKNRQIFMIFKNEFCKTLHWTKANHLNQFTAVKITKYVGMSLKSNIRHEKVSHLKEVDVGICPCPVLF